MSDYDSGSEEAVPLQRPGWGGMPGMPGMYGHMGQPYTPQVGNIPVYQGPPVNGIPPPPPEEEEYEEVYEEEEDEEEGLPPPPPPPSAAAAAPVQQPVHYEAPVKPGKLYAHLKPAVPPPPPSDSEYEEEEYEAEEPKRAAEPVKEAQPAPVRRERLEKREKSPVVVGKSWALEPFDVDLSGFESAPEIRSLFNTFEATKDDLHDRAQDAVERICGSQNNCMNDWADEVPKLENFLKDLESDIATAASSLVEQIDTNLTSLEEAKKRIGSVCSTFETARNDALEDVLERMRSPFPVAETPTMPGIPYHTNPMSIYIFTIDATMKTDTLLDYEGEEFDWSPECLVRILGEGERPPTFFTTSADFFTSPKAVTGKKDPFVSQEVLECRKKLRPFGNVSDEDSESTDLFLEGGGESKAPGTTSSSNLLPAPLPPPKKRSRAPEPLPAPLAPPPRRRSKMITTPEPPADAPAKEEPPAPPLPPPPARTAAPAPALPPPPPPEEEEEDEDLILAPPPKPKEPAPAPAAPAAPSGGLPPPPKREAPKLAAPALPPPPPADEEEDDPAEQPADDNDDDSGETEQYEYEYMEEEEGDE